jgi:sigma-B regulation protein RsbQ
MQQRINHEVKQRNCITVHRAQGRPVVFGHGFGCDQLIWLPVIDLLPESVAPVTFDFMGCGRSDFSAYDKEKYGSFNGYVQDLIDVIEALNLGAIDYVGHSVGGMIGMLAAMKRPDLFKQIIAIGPSPKYLNDADYEGGFEPEDIADLLSMMERNHFEWAGYLAPIVMENSQRPELAEQLRKSFANSNPEISRRFAEVLFLTDNRAYLQKVPVPVTLMYCAVDAIVPVGVIEYMAAKIPYSEMVELNAAGHYPHVSSPQEVSQAIMAIL